MARWCAGVWSLHPASNLSLWISSCGIPQAGGIRRGSCGIDSTSGCVQPGCAHAASNTSWSDIGCSLLIHSRMIRSIGLPVPSAAVIMLSGPFAAAIASSYHCVMFAPSTSSLSFIVLDVILGEQALAISVVLICSVVTSLSAASN